MWYYSSTTSPVHAVLFIHHQSCSRGTVHPPPVLFTRYCSSTVGNVRTVLFISHRFSAPCGHHAGRHRGCYPPCARLEAIVKKAEDAEVQAAATRRRVQAARLLEEEESKAVALEQTTTAARQHVPSFLHRHLPRPRPRSSSPPPLRPTKTRSSLDFTFRRPQCSTSANW
jgi:hypothetical protein